MFTALQKVFLFVLLSLIFIKCYNQNMTTFQITDGSNNVYIVTKDSIIYEPIDMVLSSSGYYDGGQSWAVKISDDEFSKIQKQIELLLADKKIHTSKRTMGTSVIKKTENNQETVVFIKYNCEQMDKIFDMLNSFKP